MDRCERNTDKIIDGLTGNLSVPDRRELEAHLATCPDCRRASAEMHDLWAALAAVPIPASANVSTLPAPPPDSRRSHRRSRTRTILTLAAMLVVGLIGGYAAAPIGRDTIGAGSEAGSYLLLLRQPNVTLGPDTPPESELVREYGAWAGRLAQRKALVMGERLNDDVATFLTGHEPDPSARETAPYISGFFLVRASSLSDATAIALTMPHLRYGGSVEVREVAKE